MYAASGLDDFEDEIAQESQDFAFLLRTRIASEHKQKQDIKGFEVSKYYGSGFTLIYPVSKQFRSNTACVVLVLGQYYNLAY